MVLITNFLVKTMEAKRQGVTYSTKKKTTNKKPVKYEFYTHKFALQK
jgi:hypothetical protein